MKKTKKARKVINIFTREAITELPFQKDAATAILNYLLKYGELKGSYKKVTVAEHVILDAVLQYVANASGTNANDMFVRALTEIDPSFGEAL
jgi:hypothetical protein